MATETRELLDYHIYPYVDKSSLLAELEPVERGDYYALRCPECGQKEAYIYKDGLWITCNRLNNCGATMSLWDYVQKTKGLSNRETLETLAYHAGVTLPALSPAAEERFREENERATLLEEFYRYSVAKLFSDDGLVTLEYLLHRGYTTDDVKAMQLGHYPIGSKVFSYLQSKGFSEDSIRQSGLTTKGLGESHTLTIPYRDPVGRIKGFIVRTTNTTTQPKYLFTWGTDKDTFFNLQTARKEKHLVIVEGFLDALYATIKGIKGVVAVGGSAITTGQAKNLLHYKISSCTLSFDNDEAGYKATISAIDHLSQQGINSYVAEIPDTYKDPDELIRSEGSALFQSCIDKATSSIKWRTNSFFTGYSIASDREKQEAKDQAFHFALRLKDSLHAKEALGVIAARLDIDQDTLTKEFQEHYDRRIRSETEAAYKDLMQTGLHLAEEGKIDELQEILHEKNQEIKAASVSALVERYTYGQFITEMTQIQQGLSTGYRQLDSYVTIKPGTITIIAGRPRHGKTTTMLNLFLNMIEQYPDKQFYFFSYEEPRRDLTLKVLNILTNHVLNPSHKHQNLLQIEQHVKMKSLGNEALNFPVVDTAMLKLQELIDTGRLQVIDHPLYVNELTNILAYLNERHDIGAIFIDYIQKIKIHGKFQSRQIELQKVSEAILESAKGLSLPIILGAQLNRDAAQRGKPKLEHLRESGDIENDANTVLGIYNESVEKSEEGEMFKNDDPVDLEISILKNRNGKSNETITLCFDRPRLKILDDMTSTQKEEYRNQAYPKSLNGARK